MSVAPVPAETSQDLSVADTREQERLCAGSRRDGAPCNSYAWPNGYCRSHQGQARDADPGEPDPEPEPEEAADPVERRTVLPGKFREALSEDLAADYAEVHGALRAAMKSEREVWIDCPHCRKRSTRNLPDVPSQLKAIALWSEMGFGKAASAVAPAKPPTFGDFGLKSLEEMTSAELEVQILSRYLADPERVEADREFQKKIGEALARGDTVEWAAINAANDFGVTRDRIAQALGLPIAVSEPLRPGRQKVAPIEALGLSLPTTTAV